MFKILFIKITNSLGGIERFIMNYIKNSNSSDFSIGIAADCSDYVIPDFWFKNNVTIELCPNRKHYFSYKKNLKQIIAKYDIIHINKNSLIDITAITIAHKLGKKVIVHSHNTSSSNKSKLLFLHYFNRGKINKIADVKLACSQLAGQWLFGKNNFTLLPNGVDTDIFTIRENRLKFEMFGVETSKVYGNICRFTEQKNLLFLLDIFSELYKNDKNNKFILVGDGPLMPQIKDKINELNLNNVCILTGEVINPQDYYSIIDYIISPSIFEGFPMSLVEAQACGKIVFASDSITKEIKVTDGVHFISNKKSAQEWANIIFETIKQRNEMDENDIRNQFLLSPYTINNTLNLLNKLYLKVLTE